MRRAPAENHMPLFSWPEHTEIAAIDAKRRSLIARISKMRFRSDRRMRLEAELKQLTTEQLRLMNRLKGH
ncbi:hypothetical protein ACXHXM_02090